ncbi:unnamed protein product [Ectocarpus sp. 8 AP-2014]
MRAVEHRNRCTRGAQNKQEGAPIVHYIFVQKNRFNSHLIRSGPDQSYCNGGIVARPMHVSVLFVSIPREVKTALPTQTPKPPSALRLLEGYSLDYETARSGVVSSRDTPNVSRGSSKDAKTLPPMSIRSSRPAKGRHYPLRNHSRTVPQSNPVSQPPTPAPSPTPSRQSETPLSKRHLGHSIRTC